VKVEVLVEVKTEIVLKVEKVAETGVEIDDGDNGER
jgi:hypothetical protein